MVLSCSGVSAQVLWSNNGGETWLQVFKLNEEELWLSVIVVFSIAMSCSISAPLDIVCLASMFSFTVFNEGRLSD